MNPLSTADLLAHLRRLDINLWLEGDRLRFNAPAGALTPDLRAELSRRKPDIINFLRRAQTITQAHPPPITAAARSGRLPLSFAQQRLWFLDRLEPNSPLYNITAAFRLNGPLNIAALEHSLNEMVRRHQILRTTFAKAADSQPVQVVAPALAIPLEVVELQRLPEPDREPEARRLAAAEARRPFNLARGPLLRACLFRLAPKTHLFQLTMHHIISDGWSMGVFNRELSALYPALAAGRNSSLPPLPVQYADYAIWQREWLRGSTLSTQLAYWQQQLGRDLPVLQLPADRPRPRVQTHNGKRYTFTLPPSLVAALKALCRQENVTMFMALLAAFQALLHRYTGQSKIPTGSPVANRRLPELEDLVGFFVNTLVFCTNCTGNPTFRQLLGRVRETALGAYAHQDLPFEQLVEHLKPERNLSHSPLFQVMFVWQNSPGPPLELPGIRAEPVKIERGTAKFDLTLFLEESAAGLTAALEYNTGLFEAATITRMAGHFQTLLSGAVAHPGQRLADLPLLTPNERQQLLVTWNSTRRDFAGMQPACLHRLFEAQTRRTPNATALVFEDTRLTYRQLNRRANQLARYLQAKGAGPEMIVGVCMERSAEMVVALLGVLKAGAAYVPLDPDLPPERLAFMLSDTRAALLLTQQRLVNSLPPNRPQPVCLDTDWANIAPYSPENLPVAVSEQNLAYVIYTSGSTGRPKGVLVPHRGIVNRIAWTQDILNLTPADRVLQKTPLSFDVSVWEIFLPLLTGACLVAARPGGHRDSRYLLQTIVEQQITLAHFVPSMLALFLAEPGLEACNRTLKHVWCGGEALSPELREQFFARLDARLYNGYGPTEASVGVTYHKCNRNRKQQAVPIGRPQANNQVYLLDSALQPVPVGVPGELYIGGVSLARGYLGQPGLTAEKFIPHPFSPQPGARLYKTGDIARYRPDGAIEFLGRVDHQVKVRGYRIEPGEIETVLAGHPAVQKAVVIVREDTPGNRRLAAYVVPNGQIGPDPVDKLRRYLLAKLPNYMVPATFSILDTLPLTPSGKVDRRALPAPEPSRPGGQAGYTAPRDRIELALAQIWADLLDVRPVGVHDNFFDLGGHSLLAVRLMARIQQQFGQDLPLATLFQGATIDHLARILRRHAAVLPQSPLVGIQTRGSQPPFFCVHPADGSVLRYVELARYLGPDRPFYGLQTMYVNGNQPADTRLEAMAARYLHALQSIQPTGPYYLGGWSMGGVVAFEMAQQLHRQGQTVGLLALLDSRAPASNGAPPPENGAAEEGRLLLEFLRNLQSRFGNDGDPPPAVTGLHHLSLDEKLHYILEQARLLENLLPDGGLVHIHRLWHAFKTNIGAVRAYRPQVYPGRMVLFKAGMSRSAPPDHSQNWRSLVNGPVEICVVPGNHYSMLARPNVEVLAQKLAACLEQGENWR